MFSFLKNFCQKNSFLFSIQQETVFYFFGLIFPTSMGLQGLPLIAQGRKRLPLWPNCFDPSPLQGFLHLPQKRSAAAVRDTIPDPSGHLAWQEVTVPISMWEGAPRFVCQWASGCGRGCIQRREPVPTPVRCRRQSPDRAGSGCSPLSRLNTLGLCHHTSCTIESNGVLVLMEPHGPETNCRLQELGSCSMGRAFSSRRVARFFRCMHAHTHKSKLGV